MPMLDAFLVLIKEVPATFWGVFAGSFFSLAGVVISNRASDKRMGRQFLNERELRNRDRDLALRKEVYLSVAEAVHAGFLMLGTFSNLALSQEKLTEGWLDRSPAIAKLQLIANEETMRRVVDVVSELTTIILELTVKRVPLALQRENLAFLEKQTSGFEQERDRWIEMMKVYNLAGLPDQKRWDMIQYQFKFEEKRISEADARKIEGNASLYANTLEFQRVCLSESRRLHGLIIPALVAMRQELGIPTDIVILSDIFKNSQNRQRAASTKFLEDAENYFSTIQPTVNETHL